MEARFRARSALKAWQPIYNASPSQQLPVILSSLDHSRTIRRAMWGFRGSGRRPTKKPHINVRMETAAERPLSSHAYRGRRHCLVLADGYFEWVREGAHDGVSDHNQPYWIHRKDGEPFAIAGIWDISDLGEKDDEVTFAILTTEAIGDLYGIHTRMPLILRGEKEEAQWLDLAGTGGTTMWQPFPPDILEWWAVSPLVGHPTFNEPAAIAGL